MSIFSLYGSLKFESPKIIHMDEVILFVASLLGPVCSQNLGEELNTELISAPNSDNGVLKFPYKLY